MFGGLKNLARREDYLLKHNTSKLKPQPDLQFLKQLTEQKMRKYSESEINVHTGSFEDNQQNSPPSLKPKIRKISIDNHDDESLDKFDNHEVELPNKHEMCEYLRGSETLKKFEESGDLQAAI